MSLHAPSVDHGPSVDHAPSLGHATAPEGARADVFSLTRALVLTKEAYRNLWSRPRHAGTAGAAESSRSFGKTPTVRARRTASRKSTSVPDVLTPWDLIDEDPSPTGVTFAVFQQRPRASRLHLSPQQQAA